MKVVEREKKSRPDGSQPLDRVFMAQKIKRGSAYRVRTVEHENAFTIRHITVAFVIIFGLVVVGTVAGYFITKPTISDCIKIAGNSGDPAAIYSQMTDAHAKGIKDLANVTIVLMIPVFSTTFTTWLMKKKDDEKEDE